MAITYDRVTLSQANFYMLKYDYSDRNDIFDSFAHTSYVVDTPTSIDDLLGDVHNSSVFAQMLLQGIQTMNLYDVNQNVIGDITIEGLVTGDIDKIYDTSNYGTTVNTDPEVVNTDESTSEYPAYRTSNLGVTYTAGVQYERYFAAPRDNATWKITINLNNENRVTTISNPTIVRALNNRYGNWPSNKVTDPELEFGRNVPTLGLVSKTTGGVTHYYLSILTMSASKGNYAVESQYIIDDLIADNLNITDYIVEEDGYVNELNNRFSPRVYSDMTGIYLVDMNMMQTKVVPALVDYGFDDFIADSRITGGAGQNKECVQAIRWYYGIKDYIQKSEYDYDIVVGKNYLRYNSLPDSYIVTKYAKSEFCLWHTSPLSVPAHFNNYLDFVSSYKLYLPYYGFLDIEPNDIVGGTIQVYYGINLVTGHTNITVACKNTRTGNKDFKYYTVSCTVGEEIPFGTNLYKNMSLTLAMNVVDAAKFAANTGAKLYGAGASASIGQIGADTSATLSTNNAMINGAALAGAGESTLKVYAKDSIEKATGNAGNIAALSKKNAYMQHANDIVQSIPTVPNVQRSSSFNSESGTLDELFPYLLITRPVNVEPADYEDYGGLPSSESVLLSNCNGFTQIRAAHPDTMANAPKYIDEILAQLQAGVYL